MLFHGLGIEKDTDEAIKWYEKSGDDGKSRAFEEIAKVYHQDLDNQDLDNPENYSNGIKCVTKHK